MEEGVAELNIPRLKPAATMQILLVISCVVAAVFNRGMLKPSSATAFGIIIIYKKLPRGRDVPAPFYAYLI